MDKVVHKFARLKRLFEEREREVFHKTFPKNETDLYNELNNRRTDINKLKQAKVINEKQYKKIYLPSQQKTYSDQFDFTLLHVLNRNFCFEKPRTGWDNEPDVSDITVIADLIRLKIGRNDIVHLGYIGTTNKEYKRIYQKVKLPLKRLGCTSEELQKCEPSPLRFSYNPCAIPNFVSRSNEIRCLHRAVKKAKKNNALAVVVSAISGTGKTEFSKKYFDSHDKFYNFNVIWIDHSAATIAQTFKDLAQYIEIALKNEKGDEKEISVIINQIHDYFREEHALFVFDNYDYFPNENLNDDLIRYIPDGQHVSTIVTSQREINNHTFAEFKLSSLDVEKCIEFVKIYNPDTKEDSSIKEILKIYGCNAFGMQQCVDFVRESKISFNEYLDQLKKEPKNLKACRSVNITINKLKGESGTAYKLLKQLVFLDKNEIQRGFFICGYHKLSNFVTKKVKINSTLNTLERYSLVTITKNEDSLDDIISLHSIVQTAMIEIMKEEDSILTEFQRLMDYIFDKRVNQEINVSSLQFFKYCLAQMIHISGSLNSLLHREAFWGYLTRNFEVVANMFCSQGAFKDFIHFLRKMKRSYPANPQKQYELDSWVGFCHYHRRDFGKAHRLLLKTKAKQKKLLGEDDPGYLKTSLTLLRCRNSEDFKSEDMTELCSLYKKHKQVLGPTHPQTLIAKRAFAFCKQKAGDGKTAFSMYTNILREQINNNGKDHSEVLVTEHMIIVNMQKRNHSDKDFLITYLEKILDQRSRLQSNFRVEIAMVKYNLSVMLNDSFMHEKALKHAESAVYLRTIEYDRMHKDVLDAELLVAHIQQTLGHPNAYEDLKSIFKRRKSLLGADHPEIKFQRRSLYAYHFFSFLTSKCAIVFCIFVAVCVVLCRFVSDKEPWTFNF